MSKKYTKDQLEKSRFWFLEPRIESGINHALKKLQDGDMVHFLFSTAIIDKDIEHHIILRCASAENEDLRIDCVTKAENMKIRALNRLSEALVEKCGGELNYIEEKIRY